jgi:ribonuclease Y
VPAPRPAAPVDLERVRLEAQRRVSDAREQVLALRAAAAEEFSQRRQAIDAESAALDERERGLKERNHHFAQHRHSYKERRAAADADQEALAADWEGVWNAVSERAGIDEDGAKNELLSRLETDLTAEHAERLERELSAVSEDSTTAARALVTVAVERQDGSHIDTAPRIGPAALEELSPEERERITTALQQVAEETSMEFSVDTEREQAVLRGQNPVEREVARQVALEVIDRKLQAAEVHPAILHRRTELAADIRTRGQQALWRMEMGGRPELADLVGTLHYRFSYGQNALLHCQETGYLCGVLAAELGLDQRTARTAGMLHDVGKAADHDVEGSHAIIGGELLRIMGTSGEIVHAVKAHHFEEEPSTDLAMLTICADAISASRPGARRDTIAAYLARLEQLQTIATRHAGVERAFPLQAGREVRIMVKAKDVGDADVPGLGHEIAREIESEMQYPGVIKVTVIRETIASATAPVQIGNKDNANAPATGGPSRSSKRRKRKPSASGGESATAVVEAEAETDAEIETTTDPADDSTD